VRASARSSSSNASGRAIVLHLGVDLYVVQTLGQSLAPDRIIGIGAGQRAQFIEQRVAAGEVALRFGIDQRVAQSGSEEKSDARLWQSPYLSGAVDQCAALCLTGPMGISHEHGPNPRRPLVSNCTDRAGFCAAAVSVCSDLSDPSSCKKPKKSPGLWWLGD